MGIKQYPIWHEVQACHYQSSKSYGGMNNSVDKICVGNGNSNSIELATVATTRRLIEVDGERMVSFHLKVDGQTIKEALFKRDEKDRATELVSRRSFL
jgi:hypothetical protein